MTENISGLLITGRVPTSPGRLVYRAELSNGTPAIVKIACTPEQQRLLRSQVRQWRQIESLLDAVGLYPLILGSTADGLVLESLGPQDADLSDLSLTEREGVIAAALHLTFAAASQPLPHSCTTAARAGGAFLGNELDLRVRRLSNAHPTMAAGARLRLARLYAIVDSLSDAAPPLAWAAHGDLGLNNVLPRVRSGVTAVHFVDTRCHWIDGCAVWDPIFDAAAVLAFECRILPAFGARGWDYFGRPATQVRVAEPTARWLVEQAVVRSGWDCVDPAWPERLEVALAIRLLGNASIQLGSGSSPLDRANLVLRLAGAQIATLSSRVEPGAA